MKKAGIGFSLSLVFTLLFFLADRIGNTFDLMQSAILAIQGACALAAGLTLIAAVSSLMNYY
jgi:hypothetical protein